MKKIFYICVIALCFNSCVDIKTPQEKLSSSNVEIPVELLFEHNGCKMYRFTDCGRFIYFSDCRGNTNYTKVTQNGKQRTVTHVQTINSGK